jgi:carbonic anhydrase
MREVRTKGLEGVTPKEAVAWRSSKKLGMGFERWKELEQDLSVCSRGRGLNYLRDYSPAVAAA